MKCQALTRAHTGDGVSGRCTRPVLATRFVNRRIHLVCRQHATSDVAAWVDEPIELGALTPGELDTYIAGVDALLTRAREDQRAALHHKNSVQLLLNTAYAEHRARKGDLP